MVTQIELDTYKSFIEDLAKTNNTQLFASNGELYMSVTMSVMLRATNNIVRLYCYNFNESPITKQPYWNALRELLIERKEIRILCDTREAEKEIPMHLLRMEKELRSDTNLISVKVITKEDRNKIRESVAEEHYKFGVFDENKFIVWYTQNEEKAFASFNRPEACKFLIDLFDKAFTNSKEVIV